MENDFTLSSDDVLDAVGRADRRRIVRTLADCRPDESVPVQAITPVDEAGLPVGWYHNHLPKLADMRVIEWNTDEGTVARGPAFDAALALLERVDEVTAEPVDPP